MCLSIEPLPRSISLRLPLPAEMPEAIGVIAVRGENVAPGYYALPAREAAVPFQTGDVGFVDSEGRVWTLGRASDAFAWEGLAVFPVAVEAAVLQIEQVSRCVLVQARPDVASCIICVSLAAHSACNACGCHGTIKAQPSMLAVLASDHVVVPVHSIVIAWLLFCLDLRFGTVVLMSTGNAGKPLGRARASAACRCRNAKQT